MNVSNNQSVKSLENLLGGVSVNYSDLRDNLSDGCNMGEIVFAKGKKKGSFTRVNNHAGRLAFFNNVVTTAEQNRVTNAAVFKALFAKYGDQPLENYAGILNGDFTKLNADQVKNLFENVKNPYLREAFNYLLVENGSAPLSRDELRLLDVLLRKGGKDDEAVMNNVKLLNDLRMMKSGKKEIVLGNAKESTKAEFWIANLRLGNLSEKEFCRLTNATVNKQYATELKAFTGLDKDQRNENLPAMRFFAHMPSLVNTINENILNVKELGVEGWDKKGNVPPKDIDKLLKRLLVNVETKFRGACEATNKFQASSQFTSDDIKGMEAFMYKYIAESLLRQYPGLKADVVVKALGEKAGTPIADAILSRINNDNKNDDNKIVLNEEMREKNDDNFDNFSNSNNNIYNINNDNNINNINNLFHIMNKKNNT